MEKHSGIMNSVIVFAGLVILSLSIIYAANLMKPNEVSRYQIVQLNEVNIAVIDRQTNKIYYKVISPNSGPIDWQEMEMPK